MDASLAAAGYAKAAADAQAAADAFGGGEDMEDTDDPYADPDAGPVLRDTAEPILLGTKRVRVEGATVMLLPEWQGEENVDNDAARGRTKRAAGELGVGQDRRRR